MTGRLFYLGPEETFSEQAAKSLLRRSGACMSLVPAKTLQQAIRPLDSFSPREEETDWAVVPYYNLYEGLIQETLDLVTEYRLTILAAERVSIRFALGGLESSSSRDAETIFSHPKALAQCSDYLRRHFPRAAQREIESTAGAVEKIAATSTGLAIARREAFLRYALPILAEDIGNRQYGRANYTEFLLIGRSARSFAEAKRYRTMVAVIPAVDYVGLLADILGQIAFFGINLLKIHSRPALFEHETPNDPQMFYLEMETRIDSREFRLCRDSLELRLARGKEGGEAVVRLLGEYPLFD